jgi:hypothetical protein
VRAIIVAALSSTALATVIQAHLEKAPTKITISVQHGNESKSIAFEGPNIKESRPEIEALFSDLIKDTNGKPVHVLAKRKHHSQPKHFDPCEK